MGGGLMQLVAYGAQDIYLTGNPQITFFKVVYRRHTNFSMESIAQDFNGSPSFDSTIDCTISRNGDLIHKIYVEFDPQKVIGDTGNSGALIYPNIGHTLLKEMELEIGGQRIDKHYSHWLTTWNELTDPNPSGTKLELSSGNSVDSQISIERPHTFQIDGYDVREATAYQLMSFNHLSPVNNGGSSHQVIHLNNRTNVSKAYVPLQFWFCRNIGMALPLIALQYHEVKVKIKFCPQDEISNKTGGSLSDLKIWVDYIYLDTDERRRFAQVSHEYLIEQLQTQSLPAGPSKTTFNLNHPVKELIWIGKENSSSHDHINSSSTPKDLTGGSVVDRKFKLKLNGHDRFASRNCKYFTQTQIYQHHSGYGGTTNPNSIAVYSFALKPEEHQPSGTCNFSRIDNAEFISEGSSGGPEIRLYAINYNVLRIMSGMGGLAYSN